MLTQTIYSKQNITNKQNPYNMRRERRNFKSEYA